MAYRDITKNTNFMRGEVYLTKNGLDPVTILGCFSDSRCDPYVAFGNENGYVDTMDVKTFRATHYEKPKHDLEDGEIFRLDTDTAKGVYFIMLDAKRDLVFRIGLDPGKKYPVDCGPGPLKIYIDTLADGDWDCIYVITSFSNYGRSIVVP